MEHKNVYNLFQEKKRKLDSASPDNRTDIEVIFNSTETLIKKNVRETDRFLKLLRRAHFEQQNSSVEVYFNLQIVINSIIEEFEDEIKLSAGKDEQIKDVSIENKLQVGGKKIFISHANADKEIVDCIITGLLLAAFDITKEDIFCTSRSDTGIRVSEDWERTILQNMQNADVVIFIISPNFKKSEMCLNEAGAAWALDRQTFPLVVPPVSFENLPPVIKRIQGMNVTNKASVTSFLERLKNDGTKNLKLKDHHTADSLTRLVSEFITSVKWMLVKMSYSLIESSVFIYKSKFYVAENYKLRQIPDRETLQVLGLDRIKPKSLTQAQFENLEQHKKYNSVKKAEIFRLKNSVKQFVFIDRKLMYIPDEDTWNFIAQFNDKARNPIYLPQEGLNCFDLGNDLNAIPFAGNSRSDWSELAGPYYV